MQVKLSTKEKFTVITPQEPILSANMAAELNEMLLGYIQKDIPHIILNFEQVNKLLIFNNNFTKKTVLL
jgi:hypothetical protein